MRRRSCRSRPLWRGRATVPGQLRGGGRVREGGAFLPLPACCGMGLPVVIVLPDASFSFPMPSARWPRESLNIPIEEKSVSGLSASILCSYKVNQPKSYGLYKQKIIQRNHLNQQQPWVLQVGCVASIPCKHAAHRWPRAGQASVSNMDDARARIGTAISTALKEIKPISISINWNLPSTCIIVLSFFSPRGCQTR